MTTQPDFFADPVDSTKVATGIRLLPAVTSAKESRMSSLEIAALTGKPHGNIMQDIRRILFDVEIDQQEFLSIFLDVYKREQPCYLLPRRECDLVMSGYSVKYRLAIIDRWQELEVKQSLVIPTHSEALRLWADSIDAHAAAEAALAAKTLQLAAAEDHLAEAAPKAVALDRLSNCDGTLNITNAAKNLQVQPKRLFEFLNRSNWIFTRAGSAGWIAYQDKLKQGLMLHRTFSQLLDDGTERVRQQVVVTAKGLALLAQILPTTLTTTLTTKPTP